MVRRRYGAGVDIALISCECKNILSCHSAYTETGWNDGKREILPAYRQIDLPGRDLSNTHINDTARRY